MQQVDGQLWLSPSDLSAFLACPHLTTLTQRDLGRGVVHLRSADAELLAAKGLAHERHVLERWHAQGLQVLEVAGPRHDADWTRAARSEEHTSELQSH